MQWFHCLFLKFNVYFGFFFPVILAFFHCSCFFLLLNSVLIHIFFFLSLSLSVPSNTLTHKNTFCVTLINFLPLSKADWQLWIIPFPSNEGTNKERWGGERERMRERETCCVFWPASGCSAYYSLIKIIFFGIKRNIISLFALP